MYLNDPLRRRGAHRRRNASGAVQCHFDIAGVLVDRHLHMRARCAGPDGVAERRGKRILQPRTVANDGRQQRSDRQVDRCPDRLGGGHEHRPQRVHDLRRLQSVAPQRLVTQIEPGDLPQSSPGPRPPLRPPCAQRRASPPGSRSSRQSGSREECAAAAALAPAVLPCRRRW